MSTFQHDGPLKTLGPATGLARVLAAFEEYGHSDPAGAWQALTATWNWAAPLPTAEPLTSTSPTPPSTPASPTAPGPTVRVDSGGYALSGQWRLPPSAVNRPWVVLPLAGSRARPSATASGAEPLAPELPDLFVLPAKSLPVAVPGPRDEEPVDPEGRDDADRGTRSGPVCRLSDAYVPVGFATYAAGVPLRRGDAAFHWTAVAALALGAARRMTDALSGRLPDADADADEGPGPLLPPAAPDALIAELAAMVHDERLSLVAALHDAPSARHGLPTGSAKRLAARLGQVSNTVHHVLAAAYQHVLALDGNVDRHPLVRTVEASSPILQQARFAAELLPPDDRTSLRKAEKR